jgi:uncharacterized protein with GYD domain
MLFVALVKYKQKATKAIVTENLRRNEADAKEGIKFHGVYWTLGKYDAVVIFEAQDEKVAMKMAIRRGDVLSIETLVALPVEEASKLVE